MLDTTKFHVSVRERVEARTFRPSFKAEGETLEDAISDLRAQLKAQGFTRQGLKVRVWTPADGCWTESYIKLD